MTVVNLRPREGVVQKVRPRILLSVLSQLFVEIAQSLYAKHAAARGALDAKTGAVTAVLHPVFLSLRNAASPALPLLVLATFFKAAPEENKPERENP